MPADRELAGAIEKSAPVDAAVHVLIEEIEELLIEILRGLSFHMMPSSRSMSGLPTYRLAYRRRP